MNSAGAFRYLFNNSNSGAMHSYYLTEFLIIVAVSGLCYRYYSHFNNYNTTTTKWATNSGAGAIGGAFLSILVLLGEFD